jgi:hypothetical protein
VFRLPFEVFNLVNGIDVEETKLEVERYRTENQTLIMKNRAKQVRQEQVLKSQLRLEQFEEKERAQKAIEDEQISWKKKQKAKELLIDELMTTNRSAKEIVSEYNTMNQVNEQSKIGTEMETGPVYGSDQVGTAVFEPIPEMDVGELYHYDTEVVDTRGPQVPVVQDIKWSVLEGSKVGGGFTSAQACQRLLQEAYSCLFLQPGSS